MMMMMMMIYIIIIIIIIIITIIINPDTPSTCIGNGPVKRVKTKDSIRHNWVNSRRSWQSAQSGQDL